LNHWGAVLDNYDRRIVDGFATEYRVLAIDYRGVGLSRGLAPETIYEMASDTINMISTMAFETVDLDRYRTCWRSRHRRGGGCFRPLILMGMLTPQDAKTDLFFISTANGRRAAWEFLVRLKDRRLDRDKGPTPRAFLRQLAAIKAWARKEPQDLGLIRIHVLVANGDNDIMVPTSNRHDMARRIPNAELVIYKDTGHGGIFQYHAGFVLKALGFLAG